jgi:hypothetical protein
MGFCASVAGRKYNRQIANPSCGSGWTNIAEHFILTSTLVFQSAAVPGGRNTNSTPAAKPCSLSATRRDSAKLNRKSNKEQTNENEK